MKKIAYIMHVDWRWIKQRPHFIAEELSKWYEIDVFYIANFRRKMLVPAQTSPTVCLAGFFIKLPFSARSSIVKFIENRINRRTQKKLNNSHYDWVWITSPVVLDFVNINLTKNVIYDCMDDVLAFPQKGKIIDLLKRNELLLLNKSSVIIASSNDLKRKLHVRGYKGEITVINNALNRSFIQEYPYEQNQVELVEKKFRLAYFGTISKWMDMNMLERLLQNIPNIEIILIGPLEIKLPKHGNLIYISPVAHSELKRLCSNTDAFIMPFIINDLILSVDPVKIYEYLSFGKPVVAINYDETKKFLPYISLYNNYEQLEELILNIINNKYVTQDRINVNKFLQKNCWDSRAFEIHKLLGTRTNGE
ncbi:glycosyltransferase [Paenibacillus planticolens]|uniref:Glycosyltransferase involved in cell wall biosynthesis n=1 Tax=Paenibacillus planticolens TaxID=2654976 RepID=A0ABX1ZMN4_9BACL|nr:hypothetical protein [Paenibacillus planticolens]NOV00275.1 hypothetical protein [Paenibacillus planticolens]